MKKYGFIPKIETLFWILFLISLPVTSFPFFPAGFGGSTLVRPLSVYPLIALFLVAVLPRFFRRPVTRTLLPLLFFVLAALISTLLAFLRGIDPVIGVTVTDRAIRTLVSLFLGCGFFLAAALIPDSPEKMRSSLRWLYGGFILALLWGSLQVVYVLRFHPEYFQFLKQIQQLISIRRLFPTRISGMTYEPNWFAEQITFLLMPWLFSAVFSGYSVFDWRARWRWMSIEFFLLLWAAGVLLFTFSRTGMILLAVQLLLVLLFRPRPKKDSRPGIRAQTALKRLLQAGLTFVVLIGLVFVIGSRNNYFARLWNYWLDEESTGQYFQYIAFDQRFTYWSAAYRMYDSYPAFGVGLGNFTFYLDEFLADQPLHPTPEILTKLTPEQGRSQISSVKGFFPRLLGETGLLGTAAFLGFLIAVMGCAVYLMLSSTEEERFWGRAGILALAVFMVVSFSFDSFSLPNMWVVMGFIAAAPSAFQSSEDIVVKTNN